MTISDANGKRLDPQDDTSRIEFPDQFDDTKYTKQQMADLLGSRKFLNSLQPMQDNPRDNSDPVHANYNRIASLQGHKLTKSSRFMVQKTDNLVKKAPARRNILSLKCENTRFMSKKSVNLQQGLTARDISKNQYASQVAVSFTNLFGQPDTKKVLVVDDEVFLLEFLREILETLGLEVYTASSPERALEISTTLGNMSKKINLVYMDYNMPNMNGAECTKILKSEVHKRVMEGAWFTVQTAQNDKLVRDQFKAVGVTDFLSKPYTFDQIVQHLKARGLLVEN